MKEIVRLIKNKSIDIFDKYEERKLIKLNNIRIL